MQYRPGMKSMTIFMLFNVSYEQCSYNTVFGANNYKLIVAENTTKSAIAALEKYLCLSGITAPCSGSSSSGCLYGEAL